MTRLVCTPLGSSARDSFCTELEHLDYGEGVLILPNGLLMDDVQKKSRVQCFGLDTLASRIINLNGDINLTLINRRSQELIVEEMLKDIFGEENMDYFGTLVNKVGFIKAMTSLIGQLSRSGATQEEISTALRYWHAVGDAEADEAADAKTSHKILKDKEISLLYNYYRNYLKQKQWFDLEGKYRLAIAKLRNHQSFIPWKKVYFSDFNAFDSLQLEVIKALAERCEVTVGLCYEKRFTEQDNGREKLFAVVEKTYTELEKLCLAENSAEKNIIFTEQKITAEPACIHVIKNLGRSCEAMVQSDTVKVVCFADQESEMRWTLTQVKERLLAGVNPQDIFVTARDLNKFSGLRLIADEYGIPISLPQTSNLAVQPLSELIFLLLQAKPDNHDGAEAYFRLLTAEISHLLLRNNWEDADKLRKERYFISRSAAQNCAHEKVPAEDAVLLLLENFIEKIPLQGVLQDYVALLQELLQELHLEERLGTLYQENTITLNTLAAVLRTRDALLKALASLVEDYANCGSNGRRFTYREWQNLLQDTLSQSAIIIKPGRQDGVTVTDVINVQGLHFPYIYLMGVREGEFPQISHENWIYNDKERQELNALGVDMPTTVQGYYEDAFAFASVVAAARKQLTITYYADDESGASQYLDLIRSLFVTEDMQPLQEKQPLGKPSASPMELVKDAGAGCGEDFLRQVNQGAWQAEEAVKIRLQKLKTPFNGDLSGSDLLPQIARSVGTSFSASMLNGYAQCPFNFLGSRIWKQEEFAAIDDLVQPQDEGEFMHEVLKCFVGKHLQSKLCTSDFNILEKELLATIDEVNLRYLENPKLANSTLWQAELPRMTRLLEQWLHFEYEDQINWAGFTPCAVEWDFSSQYGRPLPFTLPSGKRISFRGRIDRLDSNGTQIFVTDYKRSRSPSLEDLKKGLDLQIPIYLLAAEALYAKDVQPVGSAYFILKNNKRASKFLLADVGNKDLPKRDIKLEQDGAIINETWQSFKDFCSKLLVDYVENIYAGNFLVEPKDKCKDNCPMKNICRIKELRQMQWKEKQNE